MKSRRVDGFYKVTVKYLDTDALIDMHIAELDFQEEGKTYKEVINEHLVSMFDEIRVAQEGKGHKVVLIGTDVSDDKQYISTVIAVFDEPPGVQYTFKVTTDCNPVIAYIRSV
jgi:SHS2 domain-containing protein